MPQSILGSESVNEDISARERRRRAKDAQIIKAATRLFLAEGYRAISMDRVVEAASVSKRTLYNYYDSKEQLFIAVVEAGLEGIWPAFEESEGIQSSLERRLKDIALRFSQIITAPDKIALCRIIIAEVPSFPELSKAIHDLSFKPLIARVAVLLNKRDPSSPFQFDDPKASAEYFLDHLLGTKYLRMVFGITLPLQGKKLQTHVEQQIDLFLKAHRK